MTHLAKKSDPRSMDKAELLTDVNGRIIVKDNYQSNPELTDEHRLVKDIPSSEQSPADIFHQEQSGNDRRLLTPEARGQVIRKRTGPVTYAETHDQ